MLVFALAIAWLLDSRSRPHHVRVAFTDATLINAGLDAKVDGVDVGKVDKVDYEDGRAVLTLGVDDHAWPLHEGTRARVRWGTTVGSGTRWIELVPGPANAPTIPERGVIEVADTKPAVELDQVLDTFKPQTRADVRAVGRRLDTALTGRSDDLNRGLRAAPGAAAAVGDVAAELAGDTEALRGLVVDAERLMGTLAARRDEVSGLVTVAGQTFQALASRSGDVERSLTDLAPTLRSTRTLLGRLDRSVDGLKPLVADLRPGVARLRPLVAAARPAVRELRATVAPALGTVRTATAVAPDVTSLLRTATPFAGKLADVAGPLAPRIGCIRPYAPEAAGLLVNGAGWVANYTRQPGTPPGGDAGKGRLHGAAGGRDGAYVRQHYARVHVVANEVTYNSWPDIRSDLFSKLTGTKYSLVRPPGHYARQPWFLPECGATPAGLDPSKDPEDLPVDQRQPWEKVR